MASSKANQTTPSASPSHPSKAMSSNLMSMKFMQRAAVSQSQRLVSAPSTPDASEPPNKRRRIDTQTPDYGRAEMLATAAAATPVLSDLQRMELATAEEEAKRERALERRAADAGETKWVLSTAQKRVENEGMVILSVATAGYGDIDEDACEATDTLSGRLRFGKFSNEVASQNQPEGDDQSSQTDSDGDRRAGDGKGDSDEDQAGAQDLIQAVKGDLAQRAKEERKAKRKAEKHEMARLAEKRKSKDVNLNRLSSISGGGGTNAKNGRDTSNIECFRCGKKGHEKKDCPDKRGKRDEDTGVRSNKRSRPSLDI